MPKKVDATAEALAAAVKAVDLDGVLYRLRGIAVQKRDGADENPAEEAYWQAAIGILADAEERVSRIS